MIRPDDGVGASICREPRILGVEYSLEDELAWPAFAYPGDVFPIDRRIELPAHPFGKLADAVFREKGRKVAERAPLS